MITASQCRAARGLLDWTQQELADASRIGVATVRQFEGEGAETRQATLAVLRWAFEAAGVEFMDENGGGPVCGCERGKRRNARSAVSLRVFTGIRMILSLLVGFIEKSSACQLWVGGRGCRPAGRQLWLGHRRRAAGYRVRTRRVDALRSHPHRPGRGANASLLMVGIAARRSRCACVCGRCAAHHLSRHSAFLGRPRDGDY